MFKNKLWIVASILMVFGYGCADEDLKPILTFDDAGKGGYVRLLSESDKLINVLNESTINASKYTYSVEFNDLQQGKLVDQYKLDVIYTSAAGDSTPLTKTFWVRFFRKSIHFKILFRTP